MTTTLAVGSAGSRNLGADVEKSESSDKKIVPMFNDRKLRVELLSAKYTGSSYYCVILPSFDYSLSPKDRAFSESYLPCRDREHLDSNGNYDLTGWYLPFRGYTLYGKNYSSFVSPSTWRGDDNRPMPDPIIDLYNYVKNSKDSEYDKLMEWKTFSRSVLELPSFLHIMNVWGPPTSTQDKDQEEKNRLLILKYTGWQALVADINRTGVTDAADKNWPNHVFGDPTDPKRAIICTRKGYATQTGQLSQGLFLGSTQFTQTGLHLNVRTREVSTKMLRGRVNLTDLLYQPSYDEIVELLVSEEYIPYDLIKKVCKEKCHEPFPDKPGSVRTYVPPTPIPEEHPEPDFTELPEFGDDDIPMGTDEDEEDEEKVIITEEEQQRYHELVSKIRDKAVPPDELTPILAEYRELQQKMQDAGLLKKLYD